ncbi:hypothetical protein [Inconstantimicrobium mannanitabidum]|uniref:Uncharacterized protein n=1 Tax=Inconstantimicrobium mannanitabidum TaxID=1604901 RepID=A0ACB5R9C7_9CLOT|nr:hypothetical protein [Clostridium sp. TW13]GKX65629.1 hypothetical protein rsdtw13_08870 [Clostridium sp. TW13]
MYIGCKVKIENVRLNRTEIARPNVKVGEVVAIYPHHIVIQYEKLASKESFNFADVCQPRETLLTFKKDKEWLRVKAGRARDFKELGWI